MEYTQLKNDIKEGARSIYLLEGDDAYFRAGAEAQIKEAFLEMPELNFSSFDGGALKGAALSELAAALLSVPFMAEKRIVKAAEFYPTEAEYEKYLKPAFENMPDSTIFIIVNAQPKKGRDLKRKKGVTYINCNKVERDAVAKWVYVTLKRAGVSADANACEAVADYCLCDMARVSSETEKLIELKKDGRITLADVDGLVYKDADYRLYEMTNAIARKNYGSFTEIYSDLLGKGFDYNSLLSSLISYFKNLSFIISSQQTEKELAEILNMKEWGVKKSAEQARAFGREKLSGYVNALYRLSCDVKNGSVTQEGAFACAVARIFFG